MIKDFDTIRSVQDELQLIVSYCDTTLVAKSLIDDAIKLNLMKYIGINEVMSADDEPVEQFVYKFGTYYIWFEQFDVDINSDVLEVVLVLWDVEVKQSIIDQMLSESRNDGLLSVPMDD